MTQPKPPDDKNPIRDPMDKYRRAFNPPWWRNLDFWYTVFLLAILAAAIVWVIVRSGSQVAL